MSKKKICFPWIKEMIKECTSRTEESEEICWIQSKFEELGKQSGLTRKQDIDRLVFEKMNGRCPDKESEILKIRYWRTGRHKPQNRAQCLELARALELSEEETRYLLQYYFDASDRVFEKEDVWDMLYQKRLLVIQELEQQYLASAHPAKMEQLDIPWERQESFLRHYYFNNVRSFICSEPLEKCESHLNSINYVHEFQRSRQLLGEIPRKTMLRHLFVMSAPFLSVKVMNERLAALGYAPLNRLHETRGGERLDSLILRLLEQYERDCRGKTPEEGLLWLQEVCREIDRELVEAKHTELRFLYFKALKGSI